MNFGEGKFEWGGSAKVPTVYGLDWLLTGPVRIDFNGERMRCPKCNGEDFRPFRLPGDHPHATRLACVAGCRTEDVDGVDGA